MKFLKQLMGTDRKTKATEAYRQQEEAKAREMAKAAMVNPADSDPARAARDRKLRKLSMANAQQGGQRGGAAVLIKSLMGR